jgi:hypothetical protein
VHVKLSGVVRKYPDMAQVINGGGSDIANCGFANESQPWTPVSLVAAAVVEQAGAAAAGAAAATARRSSGVLRS